MFRPSVIVSTTRRPDSEASAVMAAVLYWAGGDIDTWLRTPTLQRMLWLGALVVGGGAVYFATLGLLGVRPREFRLRAPTPL